MKVHNIYKHPNGTVEAIKVGWNWPAFCFPIIWLFVKKHFIIGAVCFFLLWVFYALSSVQFYKPSGARIAVSEQLSLGFDVMLGILLGLFGNDLRMKSAERRGFTIVKERIPAHTPEGAIAAYLEHPSS